MNQQVAADGSFGKGANESVGFITWGMFTLLMIPVFDFVDPHVWGWYVIGVAAAGFIATLAYYARGNRKHPVASLTPEWVWPVWTLYSVALGAGAQAVSSQLPLAYTVAAVMSASPLLVIGFRLRSREQA